MNREAATVDVVVWAVIASMLAYVAYYLLTYLDARGLFFLCASNFVVNGLTYLFLLVVQHVGLLVLLFLALRFKRHKVISVVSAVLLGAMLPLSCVNRTRYAPPQPYFLGIKHRIEASLRPQSLQDWARAQLADPMPEYEYRTVNGRRGEGECRTNAKYILKDILDFEVHPPRYVSVVTNPVASKGCVEIVWGGHFDGYYGVRIEGDKLQKSVPGLEEDWANGIRVFWQDELDSTSKRMIGSQ